MTDNIAQGLGGEQMKCINCGCELSEKDFCTSCGADVRVYKRIIKISNMYYIDGLEKASVRVLSGAVVSLRKSLKFNKENIKARNLLGLVYYEMGEVVSGLSEWVISKNFQSKKNIADDYIKAIQSNPNRLDAINQTIKKYNQALLYCKQESEDLAIIQLKKVLSLNPNMVQAHQLIALLYMRAEEYDKAKKALLKAIKIDANNTTTLRYLKELNEVYSTQVNVQQAKAKQRKEEKVTYQSGNDVIIQPTSFKENTGISTVINVIIGIVLGVAVAWFLILPARIQSIKLESSRAVTEYNEEIATKTEKISELEKSLESANNDLKTANEKLSNYEGDDGAIANYESLLEAYSLYSAGESVAALEILDTIDESTLSDAGAQLYNSMKVTVDSGSLDTLYQEGYAAYKSEDYVKAIDRMLKVIEIDETYSNSLYVLGKSYLMTGDKEAANKYFTKVIELFPGTEMAYYAELNMQ